LALSVTVADLPVTRQALAEVPLGTQRRIEAAAALWGSTAVCGNGIELRNKVAYR